MTEQPTKSCRKCGETKSLLQFPGRRNTCQSCIDLARAKTIEKKDTVTWSAELGERICDMIASGMTIAEVCALAAMPTPRQLKAWRRTNPDFDAACELAEVQSAAAHLDKAKETIMITLSAAASHSDRRRRSHPDCRAIGAAQRGGRQDPGVRWPAPV